ncbi:FERM, ARHGEF and pleckstrin domain-containing protein 2 isoform X3 [Dipodomys merriami]|uniref:FERM, ARHGEF and pleckstrin domain-containing protein 2 isoform X3 n=1 Tax=Dipodomys merriami TaxID=94247 RepID=UPI003851747F
MGEIEGTYRVLQTAGTRLGSQTPVGVSTLEPGQALSSRMQDKCLHIRVKLLDNTVEMFDIEPKCDGQNLLTQVWKHLNLIECDYFGLEFQDIQSHWIWLEPMKPIIRQVRRPKNTVLRLAVKFFPPDPGQLQEEYTRGQTPAESDFQVLEIARKLEMYGIRFHTASDREGTKINLAVSHMGVLVFQGTTKINTFNWSKVRKLSFKRKRFLIKLHPEVHGSYQDTLEFLLGSRDACKNFWKICVEYHTFFRLFDQPKPKGKAVFFSRGSSFRYSGRTQKQLVDYVKDGGMKRTPYERRHSKTRTSFRALATDLPKQSISFTEGFRTSASLSSANASFYPLSTSPLAPPGLPNSKDSSYSLEDPQAAYIKSAAAERSGGAVADSPSTQSAYLPGPPALQPGPGLSVDSPQPSPSSQRSLQSLSPARQAGLGPAEQALSPVVSPVLSSAGRRWMDDQEELKHKRLPEDEAYFIAKEILSTERTYLKDLEVITVWFRSAVVKEDAMPAALTTLLFSNIDPVYEFHRGFLHEVEQRLALWEGPISAQVKGEHQRIGDILLRNMRQLKEFTSYFQRHDEVLMELEKASKGCRKLEAVYREFELQKVCYLPLNTFLLKPVQRLVHYRLLLSRLCAHHPPGHRDHADCRDALKAITEVTSVLQHSLARMEHLQKLMELQRDLVGIDNLIAPGREFIREGCLHKLTKKGLQQRMFFLLSDVLLYTGQGVTGTGRFRIRGLLPLRGMLVEESESEWSVPHCFTIYAVQKTIVVAASTQLEKEKWTQDLSTAIQAAESSSNPPPELAGGPTCTHTPRSSDELSLEQESEEDAPGTRGSLEGPGQHRTNTTMHVCWYRNTSVSRADRSAAVENQLSGYLLRKFKNSNGWQKLWVVFTNFCLFFYKTHQDDYPLASLPLLGYSVSVPEEEDSIHKDYVFKLQFKSHVYFFRAESKYTFERWMEVIERAGSAPGRPPSSTQDCLCPSPGLQGTVREKE